MKAHLPVQSQAGDPLPLLSISPPLCQHGILVSIVLRLHGTQHAPGCTPPHSSRRHLAQHYKVPAGQRDVNYVLDL